MKSGPQDMQVHTALVHFSENETTNIFAAEVDESQVQGRALMKSYAFALAQARQNYGSEVRVYILIC